MKWIALLLLHGCAAQCTLIGCYDAFSLELARADGSEVGSTLTLKVDDEAPVECAIPRDSSAATCNDRITIYRDQRGVSVRFTVNIVGAPTKVVASVPEEERTFEPVYKAYRPNGAKCDPECMSAEDVWTLP